MVARTLLWLTPGLLGSNISLAMKAKTRGYISLGFSGDYSMNNKARTFGYNFADAWMASYSNITQDLCYHGCLRDLRMPDTSQVSAL